MKKIMLIMFLLFVLVLTGCDSPTWEKVGSLEMVEIETDMKDYGSPYFKGTVRNNGNIPVDTASIEFKIYSSAEKENIIDTAFALLANGSQIEVDQTVEFEAVAFELENKSELEHYTYEFSFIER